MSGTTENPVPAIKAVTRLDALVRLSKDIATQYKAAAELRKKANQVGLNLGRQIIEACSDQEVIGKVLAKNAKENKSTGGTPTKVYSWVCDELAAMNGYNADYLKQCARNYLNALNKSREQERKAPFELKGGVFKEAIINPPTVETLTPFVKYPPPPRMDDVAPSDQEPTEAPDEVAIIEEKADALIKRFFGADGQPRVNPKAFRTVIEKLRPIIEAHGWAVAQSPKQPVAKRI